MDPSQKERYIRWQDYRINQFSFLINLFLGFAVASLAYAINLKLQGESRPGISLNCVIEIWAWSALLGCLASVSRLLDFRYTAKKIKDGGRCNAFMAKYCGPVSWVLFWAQILAYALGAYIFISGALSA